MTDKTPTPPGDFTIPSGTIKGADVVRQAAELLLQQAEALERRERRSR